MLSQKVLNKLSNTQFLVTVTQLSFSTQAPQEKLKKFLERYKHLRSEDQLKLINQHQENLGLEKEKVFFPKDNFQFTNLKQNRGKKGNKLGRSADFKSNALIEKFFKLGKLEGSDALSGSPKLQADSNLKHQLRLQHSASLVEDVYKANFYEKIYHRLENQWPSQGTIPLQFFDIMTTAIREDLLDQSRPVLVNDLADYENPYMMKRAAYKNLLEERCVRNKLDESLVDRYLDRRPDLTQLKTRGKLPPEVIEPLMAFRGDVNYSFDPKKHFDMKLDAISNTLKNIEKTLDLPEILNELPENKPSDKISLNHPFRNHIGFESAVPDGVAGGIKMGKPESDTAKYLKKIRYPTLQSVAHSLPGDPIYRANVVHAIRILERSKGWDFTSKIQAISSLIEIWKNMGKSSKYRRILDQALPMFRKRGMVRRTSSARTKYSSGLRYIRSLTTPKPLAMRKMK